ncbi:MAG: hypothetical protein WCT04_09520 [Planctomycetota bacterium]
MKMNLTCIIVTLVMACSACAEERVNHEGRKLPPLPPITKPVLFNTPEADAILSAMQICPKDSAWNEDISKNPVLPTSAKMIAQIGGAQVLKFNTDMAFVIIPPNQPKVDVKLLLYGNESDKGPYPLPENAPIEGWPMEKKNLDEIQRVGQGDRHVIIVDPTGGKLHEFWQGRKTDHGWEASNEASFDLNSNTLRPKGWTSGDAAGLPIFPAVVRYDECERGMVEHALRFTLKRSRKEYIYPATHHAGKGNDSTVAAMGERFRLKADVDISSFPKHAKAIALALKKYGMIMADNGGDWRISVAPDERIKGLDALRKLKGSDFEVIKTTGEHEGPRK